MEAESLASLVLTCACPPSGGMTTPDRTASFGPRLHRGHFFLTHARIHFTRVVASRRDAHREGRFHD